LAEKIALAPAPAGPVARLSPYLGPESYVIWKFSRNPQTAKQFLIDLVLGYREAFLRSEFYNLPSFPGAVPDLADLLAKDAPARPAGKYSVLAAAAEWSTNLGHPGDTNAAVADVFNQFIVPKMFVAAARGDMSVPEAVTSAVAQIRPIFEQWRQRGKV
jgi:multiple sugar transport system substrate-binding protein